MLQSCRSEPAAGDDRDAPAPAAAVRQDLRHRRPVDSELLGERKRLETNRELGGEEEVVEHLGDLAASERTEMQNRIAVGREDGPCGFEDVVVAADHHQQVSLGRCRCSSADGRVEHLHTSFRRGGRDRAAGARMHGRVDGDDPSAGEAGEDTVVSQDDVFDIGVGHHTDTDNLTIRCELGRRRATTAGVSANGSTVSGRRAQMVSG